MKKTHFIHFKTKNIQTTEMNVKYKEKLIYSLHNIKFLGIFIVATLTWSTHLELANKLSNACYAIRVMKYLHALKYFNKDILRICSFSHELRYNFLGSFLLLYPHI
jgi:hypothetical protein